ncbi:pentapeptide repeat-containing protein [Paracoccus spongiarum]
MGLARLIGAELKKASLKGAGLAEASGACAFFGWANLEGALLKDAR